MEPRDEEIESIKRDFERAYDRNDALENGMKVVKILAETNLRSIRHFEEKAVQENELTRVKLENYIMKSEKNLDRLQEVIDKYQEISVMALQYLYNIGKLDNFRKKDPELLSELAFLVNDIMAQQKSHKEHIDLDECYDELENEGVLRFFEIEKEQEKKEIELPKTR